MLKVKPKEITSASGRTINIVKIFVKFVNEFIVSFDPTYFNFYIHFVDEEGTARDPMNATQAEFLQFLQKTGMDENTANETFMGVMNAILGGTDKQKHEALSMLLGVYSYELLSLEEQTEKL